MPDKKPTEVTGVCAYCNAERPLSDLHYAEIMRWPKLESYLYCNDKPCSMYHQHDKALA